MSVQFRSRIKSVIDYSKALNGIGVCCDKNGNKSLKSFYDCFNDGGNYFPGDSLSAVDCPPADTQKGCCCACSFVDDVSLLPYPWDFTTNSPRTGTTPYYDSGVACNMTKCECERLKGKFTASEDISVTLTAENIENFCYKVAPEFGTNAQIDARYPRSCCHITRNLDTGYPTDIVCDDVCSQAECASLGYFANPAVYNDKAVCGKYLYVNELGPSGEAQCNIPLRISQMVYKSKEQENAEFGSCYELEKNTLGNLEYLCDIKPKSLCSGYWILPKNSSKYCSDPYTPTSPKKINNVYDVQKMPTEKFNSLNLKIGQEYQGGIYIGVYEAGSPVNAKGSLLFGNINFGESAYFYPENIGVGGVHKKWAIIIEKEPHIVPFLDEDEEDINYETSLWDGYYNTYGDSFSFSGIKTKLINSIRYKNRNGFIDYYLPSIYEMYFYWNYLISETRPVVFANYMTSSIFNTKYINKDTNKFDINTRKGLIYTGRLSRFHRYKTVLAQKSKLLYTLFFRKIVLED